MFVSKYQERKFKAPHPKKEKPYPHWVCRHCGLAASEGKCRLVSCMHLGICEVCGKKTAVTEARDFYYPKFKEHKSPQ